MLSFNVVARSGEARAGILATAHGDVLTPAFMPVATQASVKTLTPSEVQASGARMFIANTYHLWLRPGVEVVAEHGGLHGFARWPHAIVTDSGGFQAFSLAERTKLSEAGFEFASHLDGQKRLLSPEESMRVQGLLGADIAMQLDVCLPAGAPLNDLRAALERTTRWAERCLAARRPDQALFAIVQGGIHVDLRLEHAAELGKLPVDGIALGGFSVGEARADMYRTLEQVVPYVDATRPRYLMGVGMPRDLVHAMAVGVDMFDCVIPTRNARNGQAFLASGAISIRNAKFKHALEPLDPECPCPVCVEPGFTKAYLRHLFQAGEILAHRLLTQHNLHYFGRLMAAARDAIQRGQFEAWAAGVLAALGSAADAAPLGSATGEGVELTPG